MQVYKDLGGTSGVTHYDIGSNYIDLEFKGGKAYRYDYVQPGVVHVERMKALAQSGADLATYVNQNVRKNFSAQLR